MRPAYSVILFTTVTGAAYGLLAVLGCLLLLGGTPGSSSGPLLALTLALGLASLGLLASVFHLTRPGRAWRAFSQWRTSWLSREGLAAVAVYLAALPLGAALLRWPVDHPVVRTLGSVMAALALLTIICTAMIYASLKPVPQWRHPTVVPAYLLLGLATGTLLLGPCFQIVETSQPMLRWAALGTLLGAWGAKELYWHAARSPCPSLTSVAATGLARFDVVRLLDAPNTESNYLLHEMGYRIARKHADKLRRVVRGTAFGLPILLVVSVHVFEGLPVWPQFALAVLAACSALLGTLVERWLFFAEARHTVTLYYGAVSV
ncbi:MAG: dimethyl sulfoxide reductase anchor subunit family protein [Geminicoccaceae bacterium]